MKYKPHVLAWENVNIKKKNHVAEQNVPCNSRLVKSEQYMNNYKNLMYMFLYVHRKLCKA